MLLIKIYVLLKILKGGCRILEYVCANWQRCCSVRPEAPVYLYPYLSKDVNSLVCVIIPTLTWRSQASDTNLLIMSARRAGLRGRRGAAQPTPQDPVSVDNIVQALAPAMAALRPPSSRVPASAAPEKCKLEMSVGEFKAWKCWLWSGGLI